MDWLRALPIVRQAIDWYRSRAGLDRQHDVNLFRKIDAIANELRVDKVLNYRIFTSSLRLEDTNVIADLRDALNRIENQYLHDTVQLRAREFAWELGELREFVSRTFFSVPGDFLSSTLIRSKKNSMMHSGRN